MNKILKQTLVALLAILLLASVNTTFAVTAGFLKLQNGVSVKPGEECTVSVNFEGLSTDTNDIEFGGTIDYDKDKLELVSITTSGNWDEAVEGTNYAKTTGKFSFGSSKKVEANSKAFDITFKAKEGVEGTATVILKDIDISGGGNFANASTTVQIKQDAPAPSNPDNNTIDDDNPQTPGTNNTVDNDTPSGNNTVNNNTPSGNNTVNDDDPQVPNENNTVNDDNPQSPSGNNTTNNSTHSGLTNTTNKNNLSKNDTTIKNETLPKTGEASQIIMPIITIILVGIMVFFYIQNRRVDKKINDLNKKD